jgi:CrcB protein
MDRGYLTCVLWAIALGSALGGVARFLLSRAAQEWTSFTFPAGTLLVNVLGALIAGFVIRYALETSAMSTEWRAFLTTGFCGGFTTFSAFSYETATQIEDGNYKRATFYVLASVLLSLAAIFAGFAGARGWVSYVRGR